MNRVALSQAHDRMRASAERIVADLIAASENIRMSINELHLALDRITNRRRTAWDRQREAMDFRRALIRNIR